MTTANHLPPVADDGVTLVTDDERAELVERLHAVFAAAGEARGPDAGLRDAVRALIDRAQAAGAVDILARTSALAASLAVAAGDLTVALDEATRALVLLGGDELDAEHRSSTSNSLGVTLFRLGAWSDAIDLFSRALAEPGLSAEQRAISIANACDAAVMGHRQNRHVHPADAARYLVTLREFTDVLERGDSPVARGTIPVLCRAYLHLADGEVDRAVGLVDPLATQPAAPYPQDGILRTVVTAYVNEAAGRVDSALAGYAKARDDLRLSYDRVATQVLRDQAELATGAGRVGEALTVWRQLSRELEQALDAGLAQLVAGLPARAELERTAVALVNRTQSLADEATHDPLTGLGNRRALSAVVAGAVGDTRLATVLMLDLDHFKVVNDTYGHSVGDIALRTFAEILQRALRPDDLAIRSGGEEFTVILVRQHRGTGLLVADRIRRLVAEHPWDTVADGLRITVSVGVADGRVSDIERLTLEADRALYAAKHAGRDRVVAAPR